DGVSLYGGYAPSQSWARDCTSPPTGSSIIGAGGSGVIANNIGVTRTVLDRFVIDPGGATSPGDNSTGVFINASGSLLELRNLRIIGRSGADGARGLNGTAGDVGSSGGPGQNGQSNSAGG